jgi:hypothetical protein
MQGKRVHRCVNNHRNSTTVSVLYDNLCASVYCSLDCYCLYKHYKWLSVPKAVQLLYFTYSDTRLLLGFTVVLELKSCFLTDRWAARITSSQILTSAQSSCWGTWRCPDWETFPDVSKDLSAFIFRVKQTNKNLPDPEDEGATNARNVGENLSLDTM